MSPREASPPGPPVASTHATSRERRSPLLPQASEVLAFPGGVSFRLRLAGRGDARIDLSAMTRPRMAAETARLIWADHSQGLAFLCKSTAEGACRAMLRFGEFLDARGVARVSSLADVRTEEIDGFEAWIHELHPREVTGSAYAYLADLVRLLGRAVDAGVAAPSIAQRCSHPSVIYERPATQPRDAYDEFVMRGIREAARRDVERIAERMRAGRSLAAVGADDDGASWSGPAVLHMLYSSGLEGPAHYRDLCRRGAKRRPTGSMLLDMAYLRIPDLVPFLVLLMDDTGLPPECMQDLTADCLTERRPAGGRTTLTYLKRRRHKDDRPYRHQVRTDREFSAGWLVDLLLELTENARRDLGLAPDGGPLFLARRGGEVGPARVYPLAVAAWLARNPVPVDDKGGTLDVLVPSRIRKTSKAHDFVAAGGNLRRIGTDHSVGTFVGRYAPVPALRERYEAVTAEGIQAALESATQPRVLDPDAEGRLSTDPAGAAAALAITERQARDVASGAADAWVAGCLGVAGTAPAASPGFPCGAPVWGCLDCQNAVFTSSRLPHLLRLLDHVTAQRMRMDLADWRRRYGFAFARAIQIVDKFPPALVRTAMEEVAGDGTVDWVVAQLTHAGAA